MTRDTGDSMTPFDKAVEAGLAAFHASNELTWSDYRDDVRAALTAALSALEAEGWVMVPKESTEAMWRAAKEATWIGSDYADRCYKAMLAARPRLTQETA